VRPAARLARVAARRVDDPGEPGRAERDREHEARVRRPEQLLGRDAHDAGDAHVGRSAEELDDREARGEHGQEGREQRTHRQQLHEHERHEQDAGERTPCSQARTCRPAGHRRGP
jgi:hypothetical protein